MILALFTPVMRVQVPIDTTTVPHIYGLHPHHLMVCDALGVAQAWYASPSNQENSA